MTSWFPENYADSRRRFRLAATQLGARLSHIPVEVSGVPDLTIDVAQLGPSALPAVVMTSGLHGVEGPCGAAIQLAWMAEQAKRPIKGHFVLVHALNPYGYSQGRRVNEDNIDLNRNFVGAKAERSLTRPARQAVASDTSGVIDSTEYERFDALLNPPRPPKRFDGFFLKALGLLISEGKSNLQKAIVPGQYDFARGLFYGGDAPSRTVRVVQEQMHQWIGQAPEVCHLDFHTGLGGFGQCQLLVQCSPHTAEYAWFAKVFGINSLVPTEPAGSHVYQAHGAMGDWLSLHFEHRKYRFVTAEFGTYSALQVLSALRKENQAFHYAASDNAARLCARKLIEHRFCPSSQRWRDTVVERGLSLIEQAGRALWYKFDLS